jgi:predicted ATPase
MKAHVITGGPGVGKTTVVEILARRGYAIVPEAARMIIEEERLKDSDVLPWKNLSLFQIEVAKRQLATEKEIGEGVTFLDRSLIDGYAYCLLGNVEPPPGIAAHVRGRYENIFILEPLGTYIRDESRIEGERTGSEIHERIREVYKEFGYELISIPPLLPEQRADYILRVRAKITSDFAGGYLAGRRGANDEHTRSRL